MDPQHGRRDILQRAAITAAAVAATVAAEEAQAIGFKKVHSTPFV